MFWGQSIVRQPGAFTQYHHNTINEQEDVMDVFASVPEDESLKDAESFVDDGYTLDDEMIEKYRRTRITMRQGQILPRNKMFCKNASIFDVTGRKLIWGDIGPDDVKEMYGVFYLLSEHSSFWNPAEKDVEGWSLRSDDPFSVSVCRQFLPDLEPIQFRIETVKRFAVGRIVDGKIQSSRNLFLRNYQPAVIFFPEQ
jgi:hypothetical protein